MNASEGRSTRVLLGAAPRPGLDGALPLQRFEDQLASLRGERDFSRFPPSRAAEALAAVDAWLARDDVQVRRFTGQFLHGKAYLVGTAADGRAALVSSANLTAAGMYANRELGLVDYQPQVAARAVAWFDRLWESSDPYKDQLRGLLFPPSAAVTPMDVYLRALLELYGSELESLTAAGPSESHVVLADFQQYGYERARAILARTRRCSVRRRRRYRKDRDRPGADRGIRSAAGPARASDRPGAAAGMWQRRLDEPGCPPRWSRSRNSPATSSSPILAGQPADAYRWQRTRTGSWWSTKRTHSVTRATPGTGR